MEHDLFSDGTWNAEEYHARLEARLAASDVPHGEADLVTSFHPASVLDAGCGTGRVGRELARRGIEVVGVDADRGMIATARSLDDTSGRSHDDRPDAVRATTATWLVADLSTLDLGRTFDLVVLAGNVVLFTPPGSEAALVAGCARHVTPGGVMLSGFQLDDRVPIASYDAWAAAAGLTAEAHFSTWDRAPFTPESSYVVVVHRAGPASANMGANE